MPRTPVTVAAIVSSDSGERRVRLRGGDRVTEWVVETSRRDDRHRLRAGGAVHAAGRWAFGSQSFLAPPSGPGWSAAAGARQRRREPVPGTATGESGVSWAASRGPWRGVLAWGRTEAGDTRGRAEAGVGPVTVGALRLAEGDRWLVGLVPASPSPSVAAELLGDAHAQRLRATAGGGTAPLGALLDAQRGEAGFGWRARGAVRGGARLASGTAEVEASAGTLARSARAEVGAALRAGTWRVRGEGRTGIGSGPLGRLELSAPAAGRRWEIGVDVASRRVGAVDLTGIGRGWRFRLRLPSGDSTRLSASVVRGVRSGRVRLFAERADGFSIGAEWNVTLRPIDFLAPRGNDPPHGGVP